MQKVIAIKNIYSTGNVRNEKDETITELMNSIEQNGLLQPIAVRETDKGYEVIAGHRRLEAMKRLGEPFIDCMIFEDVGDQERVIMQLEENIQRKQMSAYELVQAFDSLTKKYGWTDKRIAAVIHKSPQWVAEQRYAVRLLEKEYKEGELIPDEKKKLSAGVIKAQYRHNTQEITRITGSGFSCKKHGHSYMLYCLDFDFEQKLNNFIKECGGKTKN